MLPAADWAASKVEPCCNPLPAKPLLLDLEQGPGRAWLFALSKLIEFHGGYPL